VNFPQKNSRVNVSASIHTTTGNMFEPELDILVRFALEIRNVTPGPPGKMYAFLGAGAIWLT